MKPAQLSAAADADIGAAYRHYLHEAGPDVADAFLLEFDAALEHLRAHPGTGSRRYQRPAAGGELRFWLPDRYPYAVFYVELPQFVAIIRVLHQSSDIGAQL